MNSDRFLRRGCVIAAFVALSAGALISTTAQGAGDDPGAQLDVMRSALAEVQRQRNTALDELASVKAMATAEIQRLQKTIEALTPKPKELEKK